jgi:hypothetical protein
MKGGNQMLRKVCTVALLCGLLVTVGPFANAAIVGDVEGPGTALFSIIPEFTLIELNVALEFTSPDDMIGYSFLGQIQGQDTSTATWEITNPSGEQVYSGGVDSVEFDLDIQSLTGSLFAALNSEDFIEAELAGDFVITDIDILQGIAEFEFAGTFEGTLVPVPAAIWLLGSGLLGLLVLRRSFKIRQ